MPGYAKMQKALEQQVQLNGYSKSTLTNYGRSIAKISLYFGCTPLELEDQQINEYLVELNHSQSPSKSYFKHTVYGLRYVFRLMNRDDRAIRLPSIKRAKTLPVVLSRQECKRLFKAPKLLRHRVLLLFIYSAGLRVSELCRLRMEDIDSDRMMIHVRQSKGRKDRYVVLSKLALAGLRKYFRGERPVTWLFNGKKPGTPMSHHGVQWVMREAVKKAGIRKKATVHTLRHSYATHLLEAGLDLVTVKEQMGHVRIESTMEYLHIARLRPQQAFSPLDVLYGKK
ncbi:MAG: tyrosine-type recombinase/integrase [Owenweeksia sp.]|nr:tyrosine-type recombinase/integrase [Owenweeksia sp.]